MGVERLLAPNFNLSRHLGEPHVQWVHSCGSNENREQVTLPNGPWTVTFDDEDRMTATPSIHCTACGTHGWIRHGEWFDA